ncbi:hypothetical protein E8P82_01310 [Arthrobacter echini]|uniref:Sensor domain-containing protein n=1 Tax=Arthrobacter echini TaxID=1529066 RepID=A0A4S5EA68_9MICC|nr:hypothetical protein [Arthrobacter echini]THJ68578.1 hypothetical protein E8P82_01310 [Arthrobacter echini]
MPRSTPLVGLALAVLLALSACSSSGDDTSTEPAPAGASTAPAADAANSEPAADATSASPATDTASATAAPTQGDGAGTYSSAELTAILETVQLPEGSAVQVLPTDELEQSMGLAREFLSSVEITPEECNVFVENSLESPEGAGYAAGVVDADGDAIQTIISVASSSDKAFTEDRIQASSDALDACSSFSIEAQGITIDQEVQRLETTTEADRSFGTLTSQSVEGAQQQTMTVLGVSGDLAVTAVRTGLGSVPEGSQGELEDLIDATLAAAR